MSGGIYSAQFRYNIQVGATLPLHTYFCGIADYFDIRPFQITPNGYKMLSTIYILYIFKGWGESSPYKVDFLFDLKSNPGHHGTSFFYLTHQESHRTFLSEVTHKSNPRKYYQECCSHFPRIRFNLGNCFARALSSTDTSELGRIRYRGVNCVYFIQAQCHQH